MIMSNIIMQLDGLTCWYKLFPSRACIVIFVAYITLFVNQGILVKASQGTSTGYNYNTVAVVLLTEMLKLAVSAVLFLRHYSVDSLVHSIVTGRQLLMLYFVPAMLYCVYNNLAFVNLATFDPTTYYLLLQFRVVITGVLFQIIFRKYLSSAQWFSLLLLTIGCMLKHDIKPDINTSGNIAATTVSIGFILTQAVCSSLAGVYNEHLLKTMDNHATHIYVQNIFMYLSSIACNAIVMLLSGDLSTAFSVRDLVSFSGQPTVILLMVNNAAIGIVTSLFLKHLNSILKTFASALELMFTAVLCYLLFGIPVHWNTVIAIAIISVAVYIYARHPVADVKYVKKCE